MYDLEQKQNEAAIQRITFKNIIILHRTMISYRTAHNIGLLAIAKPNVVVVSAVKQIYVYIFSHQGCTYLKPFQRL